MTNRMMSKLIQQLRRAALLDRNADRTDGQLLDGFVSGRETEALEVLVRRHAPMVWGVCRRVLGDHEDAEDAFQGTFLVLVRKAASIYWRAKVGNWLYRVAHQTALKAKAIRAKRESREKQIPVDAAEPTMRERKLLSTLDRELSQLPEKYRAVIVLCGLEGKTKKEAARQLGLPEGTVASRFATARMMLAKRLRRAQPGWELPVGALATLLAQNAASATVPKSLLEITVRAANVLAAGQGLPGVVSPGSIILSEGVIRAMFLAKCKVWAVALTVLVLCSGLMVGLAHTSNPNSEQPQPLAKPIIREPVAFLQPHKDRGPADPYDDDSHDPAPFPPEIIKAWRAAHFGPGWIGVDGLIGDANFFAWGENFAIKSPKSFRKVLPAFTCPQWKGVKDVAFRVPPSFQLAEGKIAHCPIQEYRTDWYFPSRRPTRNSKNW